MSKLTGGQNGMLPPKFDRNDPRLQNINDYVIYDGCVPLVNGTQAGSGLSYCSSYLDFPLSGDSEFELSLDGTCRMCSLFYGCADQGDPPSGTGPLCYCNAAAQWYTGTKCKITRVGYKSDPSSCCLVAMSQNTGLATGTPNNRDPALFNWNNVRAGGGGQSFECNPNLIDTCDANASIIAGYCSDFNRHGTRLAWEPGQPGNGANDYSRGYCANYVNAMNVTNKGAAQTVVSAAADYMMTAGLFSAYPQTTSNLLQFCNSMGSCDTQLSAMCSAYTRDDVANAYKKYLELTAINPNDPNAIPYKNIYQACGCHLPSSQYATWNNLGVDEVNVACDPICMLPNVIPQYNNGTRGTCNQNLCVLDNISVDIVNSQTGNINFNTVCGNCTAGGNANSGSGSSCRCVFSNINVFQSGSSVGNIDFSQNCGSCSMPDPNNPGSFINIDCKNGMPSGNVVESGWSKIIKWIKANKLKTIAIIVSIIVGGWILVKYLSGGYDTKDTVKSSTDSVTLTDLLGEYARYY
jgi:hypothetical protein